MFNEFISLFVNDIPYIIRLTLANILFKVRYSDIVVVVTLKFLENTLFWHFRTLCTKQSA